MSRSDGLPGFGFAAICLGLILASFVFVAITTNTRFSSDFYQNPVEGLTLVIAASALVIAIITLLGVSKQIDIATQELGLVKEEFQQSKVLFKEATKTSRLWFYGRLVDDFSENALIFYPQIYNIGEKVDNLYTVTIGLHKSFGLTTQPGWEKIPWRPHNSLHEYRDFRFFTHNGTKPVYKGDYTGLPRIVFPDRAKNVNFRPLILWSISSTYERNPAKRLWYYGTEAIQSSATQSQLVFTENFATEPAGPNVTVNTYNHKLTSYDDLLNPHK